MKNLLSHLPVMIEQNISTYLDADSSYSFAQHKLSQLNEMTSTIRKQLQYSAQPDTLDEEALIQHVPRWPLYIAALSAIAMYSFSAYYHNGCCKGQDTKDFLLRFDYVGIAVMISGSSVPPFYYTMMCEPLQFHFYSAIVWACTSAAAILIMNPNLMQNKHTWINATVFITAGFSPIFGLIFILNLAESSFLHHFDLWPWVCCGGFYVVGAVLYGLNWPECFYKGRFDYIGNSHNIFHVFIVIASLFSWYGSIRVFHERQLYTCPIDYSTV